MLERHPRGDDLPDAAEWCRRALTQGQGMTSMRGALTLFNIRVAG